MPCLKLDDVLEQERIRRKKTKDAVVVMITGAEGYLGGVLTKRLLEEGFIVHGTVMKGSLYCDGAIGGKNNTTADIRSRSSNDIITSCKVQYLYEMAKGLPGKLILFEADLLNENDFAKPMEGCCTVFHTASPFMLRNSRISSNRTDAADFDPMRDLIQPAVVGTKHVLEQCCKTSSVQRVVVTSSVGAVYADNADYMQACHRYRDHNTIDNTKITTNSTATTHRMLNENDWNRTSSIHHQNYFLSKTLAEQTAWMIAGTTTQYTLCTICPAFIWGPGIRYSPNSESYKFVHRLIGGGSSSSSSSSSNGSGNDIHHSSMVAAGIPNFGLCVVDVRDVADAHICVAFDQQAKGRYIISAKNIMLPEVGTILNSKKEPLFAADNDSTTTSSSMIIPDYKCPIPKWILWLVAPYMKSDMEMNRIIIERNYDIPCMIDNNKSINELKMDYIPVERTIIEMYQQIMMNTALSNTKDDNNNSKNRDARKLLLNGKLLMRLYHVWVVLYEYVLMIYHQLMQLLLSVILPSTSSSSSSSSSSAVKTKKEE